MQDRRLVKVRQPNQIIHRLRLVPLAAVAVGVAVLANIAQFDVLAVVLFAVHGDLDAEGGDVGEVVQLVGLIVGQGEEGGFLFVGGAKFAFGLYDIIVDVIKIEKLDETMDSYKSDSFNTIVEHCQKANETVTISTNSPSPQSPPYPQS